MCKTLLVGDAREGHTSPFSTTFLVVTIEAAPKAQYSTQGTGPCVLSTEYGETQIMTLKCAHTVCSCCAPVDAPLPTRSGYVSHAVALWSAKCWPATAVTAVSAVSAATVTAIQHGESRYAVAPEAESQHAHCAAPGCVAAAPTRLAEPRSSSEEDWRCSVMLCRWRSSSRLS